MPMIPRPPGPVEAQPWPSELEAHVVTPGHDPRLHGYAVEGDLARSCTFPETVLLALTGELPSREQGRAFDIGLTFLAPLSVAEAPAHAAVLGRICGARTSAIVGLTSVALAERARELLTLYAPLLAWLAAPAEPFPEQFRARSPVEQESVARLQARLREHAIELSIFRYEPDRSAALLAVLHFAGLRRREQFEPVFLLASLAPALAESFAWEIGAFRRYPMQLPDFEYEEPEHDR